MRARPQELFILFSQLTNLAGIGPKTASALNKLGVNIPRDLLFNLPDRLIERQHVQTILGLTLPSMVIVPVTVLEHHRNAYKNSPYRILVQDAQTQFQLIFFHAKSDWLMRNFRPDQQIYISGKLEVFDGIAQMAHPDYISKTPDKIPTLETHYPAGQGVTQKILRRALDDLLHRLDDLPEWIPAEFIEKYHWPSWLGALKHAHHPDAFHAELHQTPPYTRLAFDELFAHQLTLAIARSKRQHRGGRGAGGDGQLRQSLLDQLPYDLTNAQTRTIDEITADLNAPKHMHRLLQGDVGAGKTLVALACMADVVEGGGQCALLAPTEVLAQQHYQSLSQLCAPLNITVTLLTGQMSAPQYRAAQDDIKSGNASIVVGTHALIQKDINFADLRFGVIDEQHRFGVQERLALAAKGQDVDILVMSATPIPRTLELAHYGDMDVSTLDEKPPGRQDIETAIVSTQRMDDVINKLRAALKQGKQIYWICPLVEDSEKLDLASVQTRYDALCQAMPADSVGLIHGRMSGAEKQEIMARFANQQVKLLVATTAIEVGIDVPNATIIIIEQAEHFGLSQLHQLRGRVGRGGDKSTCLLMYQPPLGATARARLETIRNSNDGFAIAEADLKLRGSGNVLGVAQSGLPRFRMADLQYHGDLMRAAHQSARRVLYENPDLIGAEGDALQTLLHLMGYEDAMTRLNHG